MKKMFYLCVAVCLMLCGSACDGTKKFQNVVNVHDKIQVFDPEEVMCSKVATLSVMGDYLIIRDLETKGNFSICLTNTICNISVVLAIRDKVLVS